MQDSNSNEQIEDDYWMAPVQCSTKDSIRRKFNAHRHNELLCCIIDGASKGDVECEDFIIAHISEYDPSFSNGYLSCNETSNNSIVSKVIAEEQYRCLESDSTFFSCLEDFHGDLHCPASNLVDDLIKGVRLLNYKSIDIDDFFIEELIAIGSTDVCGCDRALAFFNSLRRHIEMGNVDLRPYLNQTSSK